MSNSKLTTSKLKRTGFGAAAASIMILGLSACSDGYSRGYSSMSVGVTSSSPGYYGGRHDHGGRHDRDRDGIPNRYDRDRDGDGTPNRFDRRPNNRYRD